MPVPASEPAEGLRTPEVYPQNEHYSSFDGGKMDDILQSFLAGTAGKNSPRGSNMEANSLANFDPETTGRFNLDATKGQSSASPTLNVNDLLNTEFQLFDDDDLPLSSQEMNELCSDTFKDISYDYGPIGLPVEEQNDVGKLANADIYSQFAVNPVNKAQRAVAAADNPTAFVDTKPDIIQSALRQAEMNPKDVVSAEELAGATFVMVRGDNGDAGLSQFMTLDPSAIYHIAEENNNNFEVLVDNSHPTDAVSAIPSTVYQAAEPVASTSGERNVASSVVIKSSASSVGDGADVGVDTTVPDKVAGRGGARKRKAPPPSAADDDEWTVGGDEGTIDYQEKRRRNNLAVRKSRQLARVRQKTTEEENERLKEENEKKSREIEILQREIKIYKELFDRSGFNLPRK